MTQYNRDQLIWAIEEHSQEMGNICADISFLQSEQAALYEQKALTENAIYHLERDMYEAMNAVLLASYKQDIERINCDVSIIEEDIEYLKYQHDVLHEDSNILADDLMNKLYLY